MRVLVLVAAAIALASATLPAHADHPSRVRAEVWRVSVQVFHTHAPAAFCIARAETGGTFDPHSVSPTDDHGEWQIHKGLQKYGHRIYQLLFNARVAYRMSHGGRNWSLWTTHARCGV